MSDEVKLLPCPLADELETIRRGVDAFNPDARLAARSAFDAAEQVWKKVPEIIAALRTRPPVVTDEVVARVKLEFYRDYPLSVGYGLSENGRDHAARDEHFRAAADEFAARIEALASMPAVVSGGRPPPCPTCEGRGVYDSHPIPPDKGPAMEFECYTCNGTGNAPAQPGIKP